MKSVSETRKRIIRMLACAVLIVSLMLTLPPSLEAANVRVVISSAPFYTQVSVDGAWVNTPVQYSWVVGSTHTLGVNASLIASCGSGCQGQFQYWDDNYGVQLFGVVAKITVPNNPQITTIQYEALYQQQFYLTMNVIGPGSVRPGSHWVNSGAKVSIVATPNANHKFLGWTGSGPEYMGNLWWYTGTSASYTITIDAAVTETATFT